MSFFNKVLSKVGIGAAKIDAVLDSSQLAPGQQVCGMIHISGGNVEQPINKIDLELYCNYFAEEEYQQDDETHTRHVERQCRISGCEIGQSFTILPGEEKQIPFNFELPDCAPLSIGKSNTWLKTNLDIDYALDKTDKDYLDIVPNTLQAATLDAIGALGLALSDAQCEACTSHNNQLPFIQEFEFKARAGEFRGRLDELELVMFNSGQQLELHLEVDRRARGISGLFASAFGRDETQVRLTLTLDDIDQLEQRLYQLINAHC